MTAGIVIIKMNLLGFKSQKYLFCGVTWCWFLVHLSLHVRLKCTIVITKGVKIQKKRIAINCDIFSLYCDILISLYI